MLSSSRLITGGFGLALALSFAVAEKPLAAQATPQDTAHKGMKMPMNTPMGKKPQKKNTTAKPATKKKSAAGKSTAKTVKKSAPVGAAAKKQGPSRKAQPMVMPMGAEPHHVPAKAGEMKMPDTTRAMRADSAHQEMGGMKMQPAPAKSDSMRMPGMQMPSNRTDSAHMAMPGMKHHSADDMMIGPVGVSMERMGSGTTWIPDAVTLPSRRRMLGDWMLMAHGFVFAQYDKQSGERGDDQFGS